MKYFYVQLFLMVFIFGCERPTEQTSYAEPILSELKNPCTEGGEPNLFVSENNEVYFSWVEYLNDTTDALLYSKLENEKWTNPKTIAQGSDWFVNWADFPSIVAYKDGGKTLAAHWLQKSANGTYDYDVHISQSLDGGVNWQPSFIPHTDGVSAEHGFVSMVPLSEDKVFATWLDGRNTKREEHTGDSHGHHGSMTLRAATFDPNGKLEDEIQLDERICDCCQTSAALTDNGVIVAYRDRSESEIRDISVIRQLDGKWTSPSVVYADNWQITGCPVNGPRIAADGGNVALVWYTMANGNAQVKIAFSSNSGRRFDTPILVAGGNPLGRVDVVYIDGDEVLVTWLEKTEKGAEIRGLRVGPKGKIGEDFLLAESNESRRSGFPRMVKVEDKIVLAWTVGDSLTRVRTGVLDIR